MRRAGDPIKSESETALSGALSVTRLALGLGAVLCLLLSLRGLTASWIAGGPRPGRSGDLQSALQVTPENWRYRIELADFFAALGGFDVASTEYRAAIEVYPACGRCWIGLAEAQYALGEQAVASIERAVDLEPASTSVRLRAGMLYHRLGLLDRAAAEFAQAKNGLQDELFRFYRVLHRLYDVDQMLAGVVGESDSGRYFAFAVRELALSDVDRIWNRFVSLQEREASRRLYIRRLMDDGRVRHAARLYAQHAGTEPTGVLDGDFENVQDRRPFGWRIEDADGVRTSVEPCRDCGDSSRALRLRFDGRGNPRFVGVWQELALASGGAWELRASVHSQSVTSSNGPFFRLQGMGSGGPDSDCRFYLDGEAFRLTTPWRDFVLPFDLPESCEGVRLRIVREPSESFDRILGGEFWVDNVRIVRRPVLEEGSR